MEPIYIQLEDICVHLDLMRDSATTFPNVNRPESIRTLRIWHCKYRTLTPLAQFVNLAELKIGTYPDERLDVLEHLCNLTYLTILNLPKIGDLEPLAQLTKLVSLSLATSPAWDSKGKCNIVNSLTPVAKIASLRHLELFGVCPSDKSLSVLGKCIYLETARFSKYPKEEVDRFYNATGAQNQFNPKPSFILN